MARGRGQARRSAPAGASGPGTLSRRTDQATAVAPGGRHGERQASEALQAAAPVSGGATPRGGAAPGSPSPGPAPPTAGVFGPTQHPTESAAAGLPSNPSEILSEDPDELVRILYQLFPHPDIARLFNPLQGP